MAPSKAKRSFFRDFALAVIIAYLISIGVNVLLTLLVVAVAGGSEAVKLSLDLLSFGVGILLIPVSLSPFVVMVKRYSVGKAFGEVFSRYVDYLLSGIGAMVVAILFSFAVGIAAAVVVVVLALTVVGLLVAVPLAVIVGLLMGAVSIALSLIAVASAREGFSAAVSKSIEFLKELKRWWKEGALKKAMKELFIAYLALILIGGVGVVIIFAVVAFALSSPALLALGILAALLLGAAALYFYLRYYYRAVEALLPVVRG